MKINDTEIFIEKIQGNGDLNFILIHNAGGNHYFFTHQIELLKKYGDVIWFDLPGHSKSTGTSRYQMNDLSLFVSRICENLSLNNICFIGLNNGADIIIDIALNFSLPIQSIILIDPPIFLEEPFIAEINAFIEQLQCKNYNKFVTTLVDDLFIFTDNQNKEIARDAFNNVDRIALQAIFKGLIEWDTETTGKLNKIFYPTLCILTNEHHCTYRKLKEEAPQFNIGKVIGSKCWATLEVPDQVNAMIERFLMLNKFK